MDMYRAQFDGILSNPNRNRTLCGCATVYDLLRLILSMLRFEMREYPFAASRHWREVCSAAVILCYWRINRDVGPPNTWTLRGILKRYAASTLSEMDCKRTARIIGAGLSIHEEQEFARRLKLLRSHAQKCLAIRTGRTRKSQHVIRAIVMDNSDRVLVGPDRRLDRLLAMIRHEYGASHRKFRMGLRSMPQQWRRTSTRRFLAHSAECPCGRPNTRIMRTPLLQLERGALHKGRGPP